MSVFNISMSDINIYYIVLASTFVIEIFTEMSKKMTNSEISSAMHPKMSMRLDERIHFLDTIKQMVSTEVEKQIKEMLSRKPDISIKK